MGAAAWSQTIVCKPEEFYRIEATVTCDLEIDEAGSEADNAGLILTAQPVVEGRPQGRRHETPAIIRTSKQTAIRTYYEAPDEVRRLEITIGVRDASGTARIHEVRVIQVMEPEAISHCLALPVPPYSVSVPRIVKHVCVCSATAEERPVTRRLAAYFGTANVHSLAPTKLRDVPRGTHALLLPDATLPASIRSMSGLIKLANDQLVIVSLPALAKLANGMLSLRRVEQDDDAIHARVEYANHATRGFALHDNFPYAWDGDKTGSFVQQHFRKTAAIKTFCEKHQFETLLSSMCDQDVTSERPICLYKKTPGGGLYVLDIEPAEADASTFAEPTLPIHLLLNILGQTLNALGQYSAPVREEAEFREFFREMAIRFKHFVVQDADLPIDEVTEQLVTIGREDQSYGLPLKPKPVILVRSGLTGGDVETPYGALLWFKQLVRMEPYTCSYAQQLASRFRLAWVPLVAGWEPSDGWRRSDREPECAMAVTAEDSEVAAIIDLVACPTNEVGIVLPSHEGAYRRYVDWLPRIFEAFPPGAHFAPTVEDGEEFDDLDRIAWRRPHHRLQLIVDTDAFDSDAHRGVIANGGQAIRIEVPGCDRDFTARSIERTDLVATLLEQVIGIQYGLIAVNRRPDTVNFDGFGPVTSGDALVLDHSHRLLQAAATQAG